MNDRDRLISAAEAFREILRRSHPDRADLLQLESAERLIYAKRYELKDPAPAHEALATLRSDVKSGKIRLSGELDGAMPAEIELSHRQRGDLDVFEATLTVEDKDRLGFTQKRVYRHVYVYADNLPRPPAPASRRGRRPAADWEALDLALQGEIKRRGFPDDDNADPGWRRQADVEKWASHFLEDRNEAIGESTVRERIVPMLRRIRAGN